MLFPKKMRFSLDGVDGYISGEGTEISKTKLSPAKSYITREKLCLPKSIFTKIDDTEMIIPDRFKTGDSSIKYIYEYAMLANYAAIPVFVCPSKSRLAGFAFPPVNSDSCEICFVSTNELIVVAGYKNYVKIFKNKTFENIPQILTSQRANLEKDFLSGVLFVDNKPICVVYANDSDFTRKRIKDISNVLITSYVCNYAQSLLKENELLIVNDNRMNGVVKLYAVSTEGDMRELGYGSPLLNSVKVVRQPFIYCNSQPGVYSGVPCFYIIPHGDKSKIPSPISECRERVLTDKKADMVLLLLDIAESVEEGEYEKETLPYAQVFGYNNLVEFPHKVFSEKSLRWMEGLGAES